MWVRLLYRDAAHASMLLDRVVAAIGLFSFISDGSETGHGGFVDLHSQGRDAPAPWGRSIHLSWLACQKVFLPKIPSYIMGGSNTQGGDYGGNLVNSRAGGKFLVIHESSFGPPDRKAFRVVKDKGITWE